MTKKSILSWGITSAGIAASIISLSACSETTNITEVKGRDSVASFKKLGECSEENSGETVYVIDSAAIYLCDDNDWTKIFSKKDDSSAEKGEKGEKGDKGDKGDTGKSCSAEPIEDGFKITCGDSVSVVKNGEDGKSCSIDDNGEGTITVKCGDDEEGVTIYKSTCGDKPYNPEKHFCYESELYQCNGKPYDPSKILCDTRDNQQYKVVTIGTQVWMAENLNYADSVKTPSLLNRTWCYNNNAEKCAEYGRLYSWSAAIDSVSLYNKGKGVICGYGKECKLPEKVQGVCPVGWHIPSLTEWEVLFAVVGGQGIMAGQVLRAQTGCYTGTQTADVYGLDAYGFTALLGGQAYNGGFSSEGYYAEFWSTTEWTEHEEQAYHIIFPCELAVAGTSSSEKFAGFSVRCLKD